MKKKVIKTIIKILKKKKGTKQEFGSWLKIT